MSKDGRDLKWEIGARAGTEKITGKGGVITIWLSKHKAIEVELQLRPFEDAIDVSGRNELLTVRPRASNVIRVGLVKK